MWESNERLGRGGSGQIREGTVANVGELFKSCFVSLKKRGGFLDVIQRRGWSNLVKKEDKKLVTMGGGKLAAIILVHTFDAKHAI